MKVHHTVKAKRRGGMLVFACLALILCGYAPQILAACTLGEGMDKNVINIALGSVVVPTNTSVGSLLVERRFPISHKGIVKIQCDKNGGADWKSSVLMGDLVRGTNKIYQTNIPGIGIRLGFRDWDSVPPDHFPFSLSTTTSRTSTSKNWTISVELFKIDRNTGNGALQDGLYAKMYTSSEPQKALQVVVSGRATTIVTPSCTVASEPNVNLGKVWKNLFSSVGSTAAEKSFDIKLMCRETQPENANVYLALDSTQRDASDKPGVIRLSREANAATGVGIQILDKDHKPVDYKTDALVGQSKNGDHTVSFYARYFQTGQQVTAGKANGTATFTITYK